MIPAFGLLAAAILAAWWPRPDGRWPPWWAPLLVAAVVTGGLSGLLDARGVLAVAALWAACEAATRAGNRAVRIACTAAAVALALVLYAHVLPGFTPAVVAADMRLSLASAEMTLRLNLDKGIAGLLLLACWCQRAPWNEVPRRALVGLLHGLVTAIVVIAFAWAVGAVRPDAKWPAIAPAWMFANAFLTCMPEESLFRGMLQQGLTRVLGARRSAAWWPVAASSLLFGAVHAGGGVPLFVAATLAGVGYGLAYRKAGIEAAIVAHFTLNAVHFLGFTYPYAAR